MKYLIATLGLAAIFGCSGNFYIPLDREYARPKSFKYFKERHWDSSSRLRLYGIYYEVRDSKNHAQDSIFEYLRFFDDGYIMGRMDVNVQSALRQAHAWGKKNPFFTMGYFKTKSDSLFFSLMDIGKKECIYKGKIYEDSIVVSWHLLKKSTVSGKKNYQFVHF